MIVYQFFVSFDILIISHHKKDEVSMRKDITVEKLKLGGTKVNKTQLARQYNCCWETIDRRLNPEKYQKETKERIYTSMLDPFKQLIDKKLEENNSLVEYR